MSRFNWTVKRGRAMFKRGEPMPPRPLDDEDATLKAALWYGYMLERGAKLMKQWEARRKLEDDNDPDDRPPMAMAA